MAQENVSELSPAHDSQDIDLQEERVGDKAVRFHRGSALTIFSSDRREDWMALALSLLIALGVYVFVG